MAIIYTKYIISYPVQPRNSVKRHTYLYSAKENIPVQNKLGSVAALISDRYRRKPFYDVLYPILL